MIQAKEKAPATAATVTSAEPKVQLENTTPESKCKAESWYLQNEIGGMLEVLEKANALHNLMGDMGFDMLEPKTDVEKYLFLSNFSRLQNLHFILGNMLLEAILIGQFATGVQSGMTEANIRNTTQRWGGLDALAKREAAQ